MAVDVEVLESAPDGDDGKTIDQAGAVQLPDEMRPVSKLPADRQFTALSGWWRADADASAKWRAKAKEWFAFRAGDQWTEEDKAMLADQGRPVVVFNRVLTILKAVAGMEINGRHEVTFLPRGTEDVAPNELLSAASKWMDDETDGEDEESEAFDNTATCGLGFVEERLSYDENPAGLYVEEAVDPLEMYWDRSCKKKNLKGARRMFRVRAMPVGDAMRMFKGFTIEQMDAQWAVSYGVDYPERSLEEKRKRDADNVNMPYDDLCEVTIVNAQWVEFETYWIVADIATNSRAEVTEEQYRILQERFRKFGMELGKDIPSVQMSRKVYKEAYLGAEGIMLKPARPAPIAGQFKWKCITGEINRKTGEWFGLVHILRDPQMWANKWISQILHILNSTAKGGILAENDAFDDVREAEESYAAADQITWVAKNALSGQKPKIMPKPGTPMTEGYVGLLAFAINSFKDVSGINLELLGQQDQNQPGVLEAMRKQAGMTVLATLFDSLRRFRKQVGRTRLFFVQNYLSDGRLIRVAGGSVGDPAKAVALLKDRTTGDYDVVVADTPTSPNQKEANWAIIQPLLVVFKEQLMANPQVMAMLLEYSPLPSRIVEAIKQFVEQSQNDPEQQHQKELRDAAIIAAIGKDQSVANLNNAKAGGAQATATYDIAMAHNLMTDNDRQAAQHQIETMRTIMEAHQRALDADTKAREAAGKSVLDRGKLAIDAHNAATNRLKAIGDLRDKAQQRHNDRVGSLIDHLANSGKPHRDIAAATKDHAIARREERTPVAVPGAK